MELLSLITTFLLLINQDRVELNPLTYCDTLQDYANSRAEQQVAWNQLSHFVANNLAIAQISSSKYGMIGENLAGANDTINPVASTAALMNSPTHRRNILEPNFTCVAIGINQNNTIISEIFVQELPQM